MRPIAPGLFALGTTVLAACGTKGGDSVYDTTGTWAGTGTGSPYTTSECGMFSVTAAWTDDGGLPGAGSCNDTVDIDIVDPLGVVAWEFGMVESGASGWSGEDCLNGYGGTTVCHPIGIDHTLTEVSDCLPGSVVAGSTTLLDASKEPYLTYYLADASSCFYWGADSAYYAALSCDELGC